MSKVNEEYQGPEITTFTTEQHIRQNPGMYVGGQDEFGIRFLFFHLVASCVDEFRLGYADQLHVTVFEDGTIQVEDDGRAPFAKAAGTLDETALHNINLYSYSKLQPFRDSHNLRYQHTSILGLPTVIALSRICHVESFSATQHWHGEFHRGVLTTSRISPRTGSDLRSGSRVRFQPDPELFGEHRLSAETIHKVLEQVTYLNSGLRIRFQREDGSITEYHQTSGVCAFLASTTSAFQPLHPPIYFQLSGEELQFEGAVQYCQGEHYGQVRGFTNSVEQREAGSHVTGLRTGITRAWRRLHKAHDCFRSRETIPGEILRQGLFGIVSVYHADPQFLGACREQLFCRDTERLVAHFVENTIFLWFDHYAEARKVVAKHIESCQKAARRTRTALG
jgi:DNA gyrase subunit B